MKFHLDFSFESEFKCKESDSFFLIGSCFSENISRYFRSHYFHFASNPFGILFDPHSIQRTLSIILKNKQIESEELVKNEGIWYSPYHHGSFSSQQQDHLLLKINEVVREANIKLKKSNNLIITLGSAFAWKHLKSDIIFANCHKIPGKEFRKVFLNPQEILLKWKPLIENIQQFNPDINIILSVSPVRYIRDGLTENNKSKASLLTVVHELCELKGVTYFPAYEILIDVLRDYRFYKEDMVHPNEQSVKYVWEIFKKAYFQQKAIEVIDEIETFSEFALHRPIKNTDQHHQAVHKKFLEIKQKYPFMNWDLL